MTISYPLSMPTNVRYANITFYENNIIASSQNIYSGKMYHYDFGGKFWVVDISCAPMKDPDAAEWEAFLSALNGRYGTFYLPFLHREIPRGAATGTPVVDGAGQYGNTTLETRGWTNGVTNILRAGDFFQIGQRIYRVLLDADSDGSGDASLEIWPSIREDYSDGTSILTTSPLYGRFRLASNETVFSVDSARIFGINFTAIEDI